MDMMCVCHATCVGVRGQLWSWCCPYPFTLTSGCQACAALMSACVWEALNNIAIICVSLWGCIFWIWKPACPLRTNSEPHCECAQLSWSACTELHNSACAPAAALSMHVCGVLLTWGLCCLYSAFLNSLYQKLVSTGLYQMLLRSRILLWCAVNECRAHF